MASHNWTCGLQPAVAKLLSLWLTAYNLNPSGGDNEATLLAGNLWNAYGTRSE